MSRPACMQRRTALLAASATTGVVGCHVLDALGLLPGVHESAAVRAAALAPMFTIPTVVAAAALAVGIELLLRRRRPWLAAAALIGGQTALLGLPEALGELLAKHPSGGGHGGENVSGLLVAVGIQVVIAAGAVGLAVLLDALLLRAPASFELLRLAATPATTHVVPVVRAGRVIGGLRGRGPPVPVIP